MNADDICQLLHQFDQLEADDIAERFDDDGYLRVGCDEPVEGRDAIRKWFRDFFADLNGAHHEIDHIWEIPGGFVTESTATFRVRGWREPIEIPGAAVFRGINGTISSVRLYYDLHDLREAINHPDRVFEGVDATFPASDPPAWNS